MMRNALTIAFFLLIGAILSVLVAWGCETFSGESVDVHYEQPTAPLLMPANFDPPADWDVRTWVTFDGFGVGGVWISEMPWMGSSLGMMAGSHNRIRVHQYSGWPLLCLARSDRFDSRHNFPDKQSAWNVGMEPAWSRHMAGRYRGKLLAIRPMPLRFVTNTTFWGFLAWISHRGLRLYRIQRRIRRGLCVRCAYELGSLETCPECGTSARSRRMEA